MHAPDPRPGTPARASRRTARAATAALAFATVLAAWPAERAAAQPAPPLSVQSAPLKVEAGREGTLLVTVTITKPWEVLAPPAPSKYATTMSLILQAGDGLMPLAPVYPAGKPFTEEDGTTYGTYAGQVTVKVPVKVAPGTAAGSKTLKGKLRYQPMKYQNFHKTAVLPVEFAVEVTPSKKGKAEPKAKPAEPAKPAEGGKPAGEAQPAGAPQPGAPPTRR